MLQQTLPNGFMLREQAYTLRELPALLASTDGWRSMHVTYEEPHVERLWRPWVSPRGEFRLNLHRIRSCVKGAALFHPHPWPCASYMVRGEYEMQIAYDEREYTGDIDLTSIAATLYLCAGSAYEMVHPHSWHSVSPKSSDTLSVFLTGTPNGRSAPVPPVKQGPLPEALFADVFADFRKEFGVGT